MNKKFDLTGKNILITGAAGLLGKQHAHAVAEMGGNPILIDIENTDEIKKSIIDKFGTDCQNFIVDITKENSLNELSNKLRNNSKSIDVLINNAAIDSKVENDQLKSNSLENFTLDKWHNEIGVGLTGTFLCSKVFGKEMAKNKNGVIVNIASDLALIAPDQRIYNNNGKEKNYKPITYSVIKHGIIGMTKYLSTYWLDKNIRVNALCPGGVTNNQDQEFISKVTKLIPLGRLANVDEYHSAIQFLCSDASSYMTGSCLVMDGGRSVW